MKITGLYNTIIKWILFIALYYYSYRYVLQYGSSMTSPTYEDTPLTFQVTKYIVVLFLCWLTFIISAKQTKMKSDKGYVQDSVKLFIIALFFFADGVFGGIGFKKFLCYLPAVVFFRIGIFPNINIHCIEKIMLGFFGFSLVYEIVQVGLFFTIGRLPSLAWPGTTSVRFGGAWDDPNGYGILLCFYFPFAFFYKWKRELYKKICVISCFVMILLTQSVTAIFVLMVSFGLFFILEDSRQEIRSKRCAWISFLSLISILFLICIYNNLPSYPMIQSFIEMKEDSVDGHNISWVEFIKFPWWGYVVGRQGFSGEVDFVNFVSMWGFGFYLYFLSFYILSIRKIVKIVRQTHSAFWCGCLSFQIAFLLGMFNLPCTDMFGLGVLSSMILFLTSNQYSIIK